MHEMEEVSLKNTKLAKRREDVLDLIGRGLPHFAIANTLKITEAAVNSAIRWWRKSLGLDNSPLQELAECVWLDETAVCNK